MKKLILLIGLLTYSSVGWSEVLMIRCSLGGTIQVIGMDTSKPNDSQELLFERVEGEWRSRSCHSPNVNCEKQNRFVKQSWTVSVEMSEVLRSISPDGIGPPPGTTEILIDFEIPGYTYQEWSPDRQKLISSIDWNCSRVQP